MTDPPYVIKYFGGSGIAYTAKYRDGRLDEIKNGFDMDILYEFKRVLKRYNAFIFCSNDQILDLCLFARQNNYYYTLLCWHKYNSIPFSNGTWRQDAEWVVAIREPGATFLGDAKLKTKVTRLPIEVSKYGHPTEKPLELIKRYITIGSNEWDVVLDPFMGSGTTGHACALLKRNFIGIELNDDYFNMAQTRIMSANGMLNDLPMFAPSHHSMFKAV